MTDELMQEIEAEYLYQCRRSFETQDCGIAANLLDRIKTELLEKDARIAELEAALDSVLIGGNHLALLIGSDHPLHTASHEEAMAHYGAGDQYEIWCCWRTMMNAGPVLAARAAMGETE